MNDHSTNRFIAAARAVALGATFALSAGCVLDPISIITDPIMYAAAPDPDQYAAQSQAELNTTLKNTFLAQYRGETCAQITVFWPERMAAIAQDPSRWGGPPATEAVLQVVREKNCPLPDSTVTATATAALAAASAAPVVAPAPARVAAVPAQREFCYLYLSSDDYQKNPDVLSPVFRDAAANLTPQAQISVLKAYASKVAQHQPGIWGDFSYRVDQCQTSSGVCWAAAQRTFGPKQAMFLKCYDSEAEADRKRSADQQADPTATTIAHL